MLCVPASDHRRDHLRDLDDVREYLLLEIEHFFTVYKDLEPGKSVEGATWTGAEEAEAEVHASFERAKEHGFYSRPPAAPTAAPAGVGWRDRASAWADRPSIPVCRLGIRSRTR